MKLKGIGADKEGVVLGCCNLLSLLSIVGLFKEVQTIEAAHLKTSEACLNPYTHLHTQQLCILTINVC